MNQRTSAGNNWKDQDEAFFGSENTGATLNYCEPCIKTNNNNTKDQPTNHKSIVGIQSYLQKQKLTNAATSTSKQFLNLIEKTKQAVDHRLNDINTTQQRNNPGPNRTNNSIPASSKRTNHTSRDIGRVVQNALVSQIPLRCAHCHSIPMMYQTHPFFGPTERICSTHSLNSIVRCVSCQRFQPKGTPFTQIGTSIARICPACARTAILDKEAAKLLYMDILVFMERKGLKVFDEMHHIPIHVVNEDAINTNSSAIGCDANEQKRGLCVWSEQHFGLPVNPMDVVGAAKGIFQRLSGNQTSTNQSLSSEYDQLRNTRAGWRKVTIQSIYVLKGLPRNLMASILAHESTHAWLGLNPIRRDGVLGEQTSFGTIRNIDQIVEEGICQLMAYLYLQQIISTEEDSKTDRTFQLSKEPSDSKLNQYFIWSIENHTSPVYGDGFHKALSAYKHICEKGGGLNDLMHYISVHRDFPPTN
jgi:hypothetical protein